MKRTKIALNLPHVVALLILYCRAVLQAMGNSTWFTSALAALATAKADVDALELAEVAARSGTHGTAAARDLKKTAVESDMTGLQAIVQGVVNQNPPDKAIAIIEAAGMTPKRFTRRQKAVLAAIMGANAAEILLLAKAVGKRAAYEWQYSIDGGKTWIALTATPGAHTSLVGVTAGTTYLFRFRATVKKVTGDWSQIISFLAH